MSPYHLAVLALLLSLISLGLHIYSIVLGRKAIRLLQKAEALRTQAANISVRMNLQ